MRILRCLRTQTARFDARVAKLLHASSNISLNAAVSPGAGANQGKRE
jgi:hypothetical protein